MLGRCIAGGALLAMGAWAEPTVASAAPAASTTVRPTALTPGAAPAGSTSLGAIGSATPLSIGVALAPTDPAGLQGVLHALYDPASPAFHHWLTPAQYEAAFAPSATEVTSVESWLHHAGLADTTVSGASVKATAVASTVAAALGTGFERYRTPSGTTGYVAQRTPLIPAALTGTVTGIFGLNSFTAYQPGATGAPQKKAVTAGYQPNYGSVTACPAAVAASAGGAYYTLDQLGAAYGVNSLLGDGLDGHGQAIGVFELAPHSPADVTTYAQCFGLTNTIRTINVDNGATPDINGTGEADLDIEDAATQAPGATIYSYEGPNTPQGMYDTWTEMVNQDVVQTISTSWGECEPDAQAGGTMGAYDQLFLQAAMQGQTILAASGDSGSEGCLASDGSTTEQVSYPASSAWVTAVGGTSLFGPGDEVAWNDCQTNESLTCASSYGNQAASGGGMSRYEPRPALEANNLHWGTAQPCGTTCREVPDISANSGVGMVIYANGGWDVGVGTSFAAPFLAGIVADKNEGCTQRTGLLAHSLYGLASEGAYGTALTDITTGDNDLTGTNGGAYAATTGWDAATGLGSPVLAGLTCPEITSVTTGYAGQDVTVSGLGLEHATFTVGGTAATVVSQNTTGATIVLPSETGTQTVAATSVLGNGTQTSAITYAGATPTPVPPTPAAATTAAVQHGYWLVGADGGIFSFGNANFYGSTGGLKLNRPVVGITPTADRGGYWLVASDGGIFSFGDSGYHGSLPGDGLTPAGTGGAHALNAPVVAMVPSTDGRGYFMVASDGGIFAFGDAKFAGSCPGIGGCSGAAVAVMPDASGNGYWLVTATGNIYAFGDAAYYGAPGQESTPVVSAVRTPDGQGYWILLADGRVDAYGDAPNLGSVPAGSAGGADPAAAIYATSNPGGYWVATANGAVFSFGNAPYDGGMGGTRLNSPIIAATGD